VYKSLSATNKIIVDLVSRFTHHYYCCCCCCYYYY